LGQLPNLHRPQHVVEARKCIGRGARIYNIGGDVYCETLSETAAVFIQAPSASAQLSAPAATVWKVPQCKEYIRHGYFYCHSPLPIKIPTNFPSLLNAKNPSSLLLADCNLKIFSMSEFGKLLNTAVKQGFEAVYSLTRQVHLNE
jgi:hypothetical protein